MINVNANHYHLDIHLYRDALNDLCKISPISMQETDFDDIIELKVFSNSTVSWSVKNSGALASWHL